MNSHNTVFTELEEWEWSNFDYRNIQWIQKGVISLEDFLNKFDRSKWPNKHNYTDIYTFLLKLQLYINKNSIPITDPVQYLAYLYYQKNIWTHTIFNKIWQLTHYWDYTKLCYLFKYVFNWELRPNTHITVPKEKLNNLKLDTQREFFKSTILRLLASDKVQNKNYDWSFNLVEFNNIEAKKCKIIYLFCYILWTDEDNFVWMLYKMHANKVWPTMIANELNRFADNMWYWNLVDVNKDSILNMLWI